MMRFPKTLAALLLTALSYTGFVQAQPNPARARSAHDFESLAAREQTIHGLNNEVLSLFAESAAAVEGRKEASTQAALPILDKRAGALLELIRLDPAAALRNALPPDVAARLVKAFPEAAGRIESYTTVSGVLEIEIEDGVSDSTTYRAVRTDAGRVALHLASQTNAGEARSGEWVEAGGLMLAGEMAADTLGGPSQKQTLETLEQGGQCSPTGAQRIAVLKVKFPGSNPSLSNAELTDWIFGSTGLTVNRFWQENSNGAAWAEGDVYPAGADSWFTLDREYSCSESSAMRQAALNAANNAVNFRDYGRVVIVFPKPSSGCSFAGRASVGCWVTNPDGGSALSYSLQALQSMSTRSRTVELTTHEGGHMLGLYHGAAVEYGADAVGPPNSGGSRQEYGDRYSSMGFWNTGHYAAPHKKQLGWIQNHNRVSSAGTYRIQPAALAPNGAGGAVQALEIERGGKTLWVEFRRRLGTFFSSAVSYPGNGALLHLDNGSVQSLLLDFTPGSASSAGTYYSPDFNDATLEVGRSWNDPYSDLSLSVQSASNTGLDLTVGYGATPACIQAAPDVTLSPASQSTTYPAYADFQVRIQNNDSAGCTSSSFSLGAAVKLGASPTAAVTSQLGTAVLTVAPGSAGTTVLRTTPASKPNTAVSYRIEALSTRGPEQVLAAASLVVLPPANTAPSLTIASPANGASVQQGNSISLQATATDAEDGNLSNSISWTSSRDGALGTGASLSKVLSVGGHTITASIVDSGGLNAVRSVSVTVTATPVPNTNPTASILAPANGTQITAGTSIAFRGAASDNEDGDLSSSLKWTSSRDGQIGQGANVTAVLSAGSHTITASVVDSKGLSASRSISVSVQNPPPPPPPTETKAVVDYVQVTVIQRGSRTAARAAMRVTTANGQPLAGALVTGRWTLNGQTVSTPSPFTTDADGAARASLTVSYPSGSVLGFVVTSVASGYYTGPVTPVSGSDVIP